MYPAYVAIFYGKITDESELIVSIDGSSLDYFKFGAGLGNYYDVDDLMRVRRYLAVYCCYIIDFHTVFYSLNDG